jgi:hypothetical protein
METPSRYARETAATTSNILMPSAAEVNLELRLAADLCLQPSAKCKALQLLRKPGDAVVGVIRRGIAAWLNVWRLVSANNCAKSLLRR